MADEIVSRKRINWQTASILEAMKLLNPDSLWFSSEEQRMGEADARDVAYNGSTDDFDKQIKDVMVNKFNMSVEDVKKFPVVMLRDVMKMIERLAMVYKEFPKRTIKVDDEKEETVTDQLRELYDEIFFNLTMREANQAMLLHNTVPIRVQFLENRWEQVVLDLSVYSPASVMVAASFENYLTPEVVSVKEINEEGINIWRVETTDFIRELDYEGKSLSEIKNDYGVIRWAFARYKKGQDFWSGLNADEMISQQKYSSALVSGGVEAGIFNLFPIILLQNLGKNEFIRGPRKIISTEKKKERQGDLEPKIQAIDLRADLKTLRDFEQDLRMRTALNRNLPRSSVGLYTNLPQSRHQKYLENLALLESRQLQRASMLRLEREIFEILKEISNKDKDKLGFTIPKKAKLFIDYAEDSIKLSPEEEIELWLKEIKMGAKTVIDYMIFKNPDLSEEDAEELFNKNKKLNGKLSKTIKELFAKNKEETKETKK